MTTPALISMQGRLADAGGKGLREASTPRTTTVGAAAARIAEPRLVPGSTAVWESEETVTDFEGGKGTKTATAISLLGAPLLSREISPIRPKPMTTATNSKAPDTSAGFDWRMLEDNITRQVGPQERRPEPSAYFLYPPTYDPVG
jgi:hypothetical protein